MLGDVLAKIWDGIHYLVVQIMSELKSTNLCSRLGSFYYRQLLVKHYNDVHFSSWKRYVYSDV